ncbi:MAG: RNA polymerase sigma factor RpoD/SigA [Spirochaetia bacterium]|nr:RNA polymerase sigma factor RpoD/SigA [Spirochaetota bacterium]MCX8096011.1 RNA polymerase sigma factor RpoD/SigA [Spirochaetota bacterium]MDW8111806.1 RNA polymerase sigma factor RpoD/SigA [Spirochaetia bacterium]
MSKDKIKDNFFGSEDPVKIQEDLTNILEEARHSSANSENVVLKYFKAVEKFPLLKREEEIELAKRASEGDKEARAKLILSNLRFVVSVAKSYINTGIPIADLISEGNVGLIVAVDKFDYRRGLHFISYAVWWIKQSILKYISERSRLVRFPMNRTNELLKIEKFIKEYEMKNGSQPSVETISKELNIKEKDVQILLNRKSKSYVSFDDNVFDDNEATYGDILNIENQTVEHPEKTIMRNALSEEIRSIVEALPEKEREVIKYRFGFYGKPYSLKEIGEIMGFTKERVRQIESRAIDRMKEIIKTRSPELLEIGFI